LPKSPYRTEADLCDHLIRVARARGFLVFPETGGFDLLLIATSEANGFEAGTQIGVEAKLRATMQVLHQGMPHDWGATPHCFAVLVPEAGDIFLELARRLKTTVFEAINFDDAYYGDFSFLPWYRQEPKTLCFVPGVEILGTRGGCPSPVRLSPWKLGAVGLCLLHDERGYLTSKDFAEAKVSMSYFYKEKFFLEKRERRVIEGRSVALYRLDPSKKLPHLIYPEIAEALRKSRSA
jgi:hypothetical protein